MAAGDSYVCTGPTSRAAPINTQIKSGSGQAGGARGRGLESGIVLFIAVTQT